MVNLATERVRPHDGNPKLGPDGGQNNGKMVATSEDILRTHFTWIAGYYEGSQIIW